MLPKEAGFLSTQVSPSVDSNESLLRRAEIFFFVGPSLLSKHYLPAPQVNRPEEHLNEVFQEFFKPP